LTEEGYRFIAQRIASSGYSPYDYVREVMTQPKPWLPRVLVQRLLLAKYVEQEWQRVLQAMKPSESPDGA
jgi:hypothetical protein